MDMPEQTFLIRVRVLRQLLDVHALAHCGRS
jgi:hypothetical protein